MVGRVDASTDPRSASAARRWPSEAHDVWHARCCAVRVERKEIAMHPITKSLTAAVGLAGAAYAAHVADSWFRYGRPKRVRDDAKDALLDEFMRDYDVRERHEVAVAAPARVTLTAAEEIELDASLVVRTIFRAREVILRSKPDA